MTERDEEEQRAMVDHGSAPEAAVGEPGECPTPSAGVENSRHLIPARQILPSE